MSERHDICKLTSRDIEIEEIAVENRLNDTCEDSNPVMKSFHVVSIDPIEEIESPIGSKSKQVM